MESNQTLRGDVQTSAFCVVTLDKGATFICEPRLEPTYLNAPQNF